MRKPWQQEAASHGCSFKVRLYEISEHLRGSCSEHHDRIRSAFPRGEASPTQAGNVPTASVLPASILNESPSALLHPERTLALNGLIANRLGSVVLLHNKPAGAVLLRGSLGRSPPTFAGAHAGPLCGSLREPPCFEGVMGEGELLSGCTIRNGASHTDTED